MARYTYNGSNLDKIFNTTNISGASNTPTVSGIFSNTFTAPNTTNYVTGIWIFFHSIPTVNLVLTLQESTNDKISVTLNYSDCMFGWNYARFTTPYKFTTLTANAYRFKAQSSNNSGGLRSDGTLFAYAVTIDDTIAISSLTVGDDLWVGGIHNSGLTAQSLTLTGTSLSFGGGIDNAYQQQNTWSNGGAIMVGNGGTVKFDNTANCTVQIRGSIFVSTGGLFDMRGHASNKSIVTKLVIDNNVSDGQYGIFSFPAGYGGQILTTGMTVPYSTIYSSGIGTTGNPIVTASAHNFSVGDELVFGGATDYLKNEKKYVKTIPSSTTLTLSDTIGGAESGLSQTHASSSTIGNMTRNTIISSLTSTRGFWVSNNATNTTPTSDFSFTRLEYPNIASGKGFILNQNGNEADCSGTVWYGSATQGRQSIQINGSTSKTYTGIILYEQRGGNFSGQAGITVSGGSQKTFVDCLGYNAPGSALTCGFFSALNSSNCTLINCHSYGANALNNGTLGYANGYFNSVSINHYNCSFQATRQQAIMLSGSQDINFYNCSFGTVGNNNIDIKTISSTLNNGLFYNCDFGSTTLIDNYKNQIYGSKIYFHKYQKQENRHRWYGIYGMANSTGAGLTDTTVRTLGSYNIRIAPEDNTTGFIWDFKIIATPNQQTFLNGFIRKNNVYGSDLAKIELFMPGTDLTGLPDDTFTASNDIDVYKSFIVGRTYTGTVPALATIRITAKSNTPGAYLYLADLYNSQDALNLWDNAQPVSPIVATSFNSVPGLVWNYPSSNTTANTMGEKQILSDEILSNTDASQAKIDQL